MNPRTPGDRRESPRYPIQGNVTGYELSPVGSSRHFSRIIRADLENISSGGLCLFANQSFDVSSPIRCLILFAEIPVVLPLLMRVCWREETSSCFKYRIGLRFLI